MNTPRDPISDTWNTYCAKLEQWRQLQRDVAARRQGALARIPFDTRVPRSTAEATLRSGPL